MGENLLGKLVLVVAVLIIIGSCFPLLWPMVTGSVTSNITAMSGTDAGTTTFKAFWPIVLMIVGLGIGVGLIVYGLRQFGLLGGS